MTLDDVHQFLSFQAGPLQTFLFQNAAPLGVIILGAWLLTSLALMIIPYRDPRARYLAKFFGLEDDPDRVIPLPPSSSLWRDYARLNRDAEAAAQFPPGAPSLQGCYLIHSGGNMLLVAVHNFKDCLLQPDPEEPELKDFLIPSKHPSGRVFPFRVPISIEQDAATRADIVGFLLKLRFGYPGTLQAITLLRDDDGAAPHAGSASTADGVFIERHSFTHPEVARALLAPDPDGVEAKNLVEIRRWFARSPGRQTPFLAGFRRIALLGILLAILSLGHSTISTELFSDLQSGAPSR